ncbi:hypothetical protein QBC47DRAFT_329136 [Echria macrotheca]|uniref:DUF7729 domain-containing protein n=1 Tax=Echria macrotheca TaxID=438768 RepID=A0AAJ0F7X1_9PEZI|nr:hypothetical protein QBC47DRAFT_329136 [Echria macrotheca]
MMAKAASLLVVVASALHVLAATADTARPAETLIIDPRVRYHDDGTWMLLSEDEVRMRELRKRDDDAPLSLSVTTTFQIAVSTVTEASTTSTVPASPLPSPFDSNLSSNFTAVSDGSVPCPIFINSFLTDQRFKQCYPLSFLILGSRSFFNAERSLVSTTQVLDATCAANLTYCTDYLNTLARNLTKPENCGADYTAGQPVVTSAYQAMTAYAPIYTVGCIKDPQTSMYCYANAATNLTNPANMYIYYLALNTPLPGSAMPSCNPCLQQTMAVFQTASANRKQAIAKTYEPAAAQINQVCGPGFVGEKLAAEISAASLRGRPLLPVWIAVVVAVALWLL